MSKNFDSSQSGAWLKCGGIVVLIGCIVFFKLFFYWQRENITAAENSIKLVDNHQQHTKDIKEQGDPQKNSKL